MELSSWLLRNATSLAEHPALIEGEKTVSYADLAHRSARLAARLLDLGVSRGDRVAVVAESGGDYIYLMHALIGLDAKLVAIDPRLPEVEIESRLETVRPRLTVVDPVECQGSRGFQDPKALRRKNRIPVECQGSGGFQDRGKCQDAAKLPEPVKLPDAVRLQDLVESRDSTELDGAPARVSLRRAIELESVQCLIHTSGTAGVPKPVELTYGNHLFSALGSARRLGVAREDRWLLCLPLFHIGGLAVVMRSLICGTTVVVAPRFVAGEIGRIIAEHGVTHISLVPTMLRRLLAQPGAAGLDSLKVVLLGGGPLPATLLEEAVERGIPVAPTYGLTESASQVATLTPAQAVEDPYSVGTPLMHTQVRIDEAGTILVRGPTVAPSEVDADRWLHTGDLGRIDNSGRLHVLGRADSVIVTGGENVAPEEVEGVMIAHPDIDDVAVFGREDPEWQRAVTAKVVLRAGVPAGKTTARVIRDFCRKQLPGFKVPRRIEFVDVLPRSAQGKLKRQELQDAEVRMKPPTEAGDP